MKYKRIPIADHLLIEQECIQFLEDLSYKGWKLKKANSYFFTFERCDHPLKYQLDYNLLSDEYMDFIHEMGYQHIDNIKNIHFFVSENLDAVDLQTDEETHKNILLELYPLKSIAIILGLFILSYSIITLLFGPLNLAFFLTRFYISFNLLATAIIFLIIAIEFILLIFQIIMLRLYIQERHPQLVRKILKVLYKTSFIINIISLIILIYLILVIFLTSEYPILFFIPLGLIGVFPFLQDRIIYKQKTEIKRKSMTLILCFTWIIVYFGIQNILPEQSIYIENNYYSYTNETTSADLNIFLHTTSITDENHQENVTRCFYDFVINNIWENTIIDNEHSIRIMNSRDELDRMLYETGHSSSLDIPFLSYQDALKKYHIYSSAIIEQCYYIENTVIMKNGNMVIESSFDHLDDIDKLIHHYFKN